MVNDHEESLVSRLDPHKIVCIDFERADNRVDRNIFHADPCRVGITVVARYKTFGACKQIFFKFLIFHSICSSFHIVEYVSELFGIINMVRNSLEFAVFADNDRIVVRHKLLLLFAHFRKSLFPLFLRDIYRVESACARPVIVFREKRFVVFKLSPRAHEKFEEILLFLVVSSHNLVINIGKTFALLAEKDPRDAVHRLFKVRKRVFNVIRETRMIVIDRNFFEFCNCFCNL